MSDTLQIMHLLVGEEFFAVVTMPIAACAFQSCTMCTGTHSTPYAKT